MEADAKTLLLSCGAIVGGLLFLFGGLYFWRSGRELCERGVTAQATVVKKFRKGRGIENYYALFAFTDLHGRPKTAEAKVRSRAWHMLREGGTEDITYLPSQPEKAALGPRWAKELLGWALMSFALVGGSMAIFGLVVLIELLTGKFKL